MEIHKHRVGEWKALMHYQQSWQIINQNIHLFTLDNFVTVGLDKGLNYQCKIINFV